jgi:hypothetical protein
VTATLGLILVTTRRPMGRMLTASGECGSSDDANECLYAVTIHYDHVLLSRLHLYSRLSDHRNLLECTSCTEMRGCVRSAGAPSGVVCWQER